MISFSKQCLVLMTGIIVSLAQPVLAESLDSSKDVSNDQLDQHTLNWPVGELEEHRIASGPLHNPAGEPQVVFSQDIEVRGAGWLRIYFEDVQMEDGGFVRMTSLEDGEVQELDAASLLLWRNSSAYFNGDTVRVELIAAPATFNNSLTIGKVAMEMVPAGHNRGGCGICGPDDRVPSSVDWAARMMPVGCSGTIYNSSNCFVTAGHCLNGADTLQFNVPDSNSNCTLNNPPVSDQFPVIDLDGVDGGVGNDYGAMLAGTNNIGQTPYERYGVYMPLANNIPNSGTASVNGYGVDEECVRTQTQQYHDGPITGTNSDTIFFEIDITFGNSGSSIIRNGEIIGVVTHCSGSCENYGTRVDLNAFENVREEICAVSTGGCCIGTSCAILTQDDCTSGGGTYLGDGSNCNGNPCAPTGGCCVGTSCSITSEADCNGSYLGDGSNCNGNPCDPTGACCVGTDCSNTTQADCGGTWLGAGTGCGASTCNDFQFQGLTHRIIGTDLVDDGEFTWTVHVYAILNQGERLDAIAGDANQQKTITTSTSFYQNPFGGPTSQSVNPALFDTFPDLRYDSYVTIGCLDSSGDPFPENVLSDIGIDWNQFETGGDLSTGDGSWYITPDDAQGDAQAFTDQDCNELHGVLVARLTVRGTSAQVHMEALFQGKETNGDTWQGTAALDISYDGSLDCNGNGVPDDCDISNGSSSDDNNNGIPDECENTCDGDYNGDGITDVGDLLIVIADWGSPYDVNDLLIVIADWGCGTP